MVSTNHTTVNVEIRTDGTIRIMSGAGGGVLPQQWVALNFNFSTTP
jgi:hypothetical protein